MWLRILFVAAALAVLSAGHSNQVDQRSAQLAVALVRAGLNEGVGTSAPQILRPVARQDFDQELVLLQSLGRQDRFRPGWKVHCFETFEVLPWGFVVDEGVVSSFQVQLDRSDRWIVVVDCNAKTGTGLFGFNGSAENYNLMVRHLNISVKTKNNASLALETFLRFSFGEDFLQTMIPDVMWLRVLGLKDFRTRFGKDRREKEFESWWKSIQPTVRNTLRPMIIKEVGGDFEATYYLYDRGQIYVETTVINSDATCQVKSRTLLFPIGS